MLVNFWAFWNIGLGWYGWYFLTPNQESERWILGRLDQSTQGDHAEEIQVIDNEEGDT